MIAIIAGTRPELIKVAPLVLEFRKRGVPAELWLTGQHESLAEAPIEFFELEPALSWKSLESGQSSNVLLARLLRMMDEAFEERRPSAVVVQGDTTSAIAGALAAFHRRIPVAHVEAGLRTGNLTQPFPEEMNRCVIDSFATWMYPPTAKARDFLLAEGRKGVTDPTGNTGIDALFWAREKIRARGYWPHSAPRLRADQKLILSTGHRRENLGGPLTRILKALGEQVMTQPGWVLYHITHPNPEATQAAHEALAQFPSEKVQVLPPMDYPDFVALLDAAEVVVSDSGGVQEEAPSFGCDILITREVTERPEVLECGGVLVGTDPERLKSELARVFERRSGQVREQAGSSLKKSPFGEGLASQQIVDHLLKNLGLGAASPGILQAAGVAS